MLLTPDTIDLIPPPSRKALRVHANGDGDGRSIQELIQMEDDEDQFKDIVGYILNRCKHYGIDKNVRYYSQDQNVLDRIKENVLEKYPVLRKYENGWPVTAYLKSELRWRKRLSMRKAPTSRLVSEARSQTMVGTAVGGRPGTSPIHTLRSSKRINRAYVEVTPRKQASVPAIVAYALPRKALEGLHTPLGICGDRRIRGPQITNIYTACRAPVTMAPPVIRLPNTVLGWIVAFDIPPADAQRITEFFLSLGINSMAYLRAFARMESRDTWLREMQENGDLSEIQMRILRDMLGHVVTQ